MKGICLKKVILQSCSTAQIWMVVKVRSPPFYSFFRYSTAQIWMVVKEEIGFLKNIESCSTVHFHMVVKNVRSIGVC